MGQYKSGMKIKPDALKLGGLPLAHRGANGSMPAGLGRRPVGIYGSSLELLRHYAWFVANSQDRARPAAACFRTNWGYSTCWETCMNGVRRLGYAYRPNGNGELNDNIHTYLSVVDRRPSYPSGRVVRLFTGVRPLGEPSRAPAVDPLHQLRFPPRQDLSLIHFTLFHFHGSRQSE